MGRIKDNMNRHRRDRKRSGEPAAGEWDSEGGALEREGDDAAAAERDQRWKDAKDVHWHGPSYTDETRDRSDEH